MPSDDERRSQTGAQAEKQHATAIVAAERLHGRVVNGADGTSEGFFKMMANPSRPEVVRFGERPAAANGSGITDGNGGIFPARGGLLNRSTMRGADISFP